MIFFVIFSAAIGFCALLLVVEPLLSGKDYSFYDAVEQSRESGADLVLDQIRDLDLEHSAGKIAKHEYDRLRAELLSEAAPLLERKQE